MYEVEYCHGYIAVMASSIIAESLFTKVDQEGNRFVLIESIMDKRTDGTQTLQKDTFVITKSCNKQRKIQLNYGKSESNGRMAVLNRTNLKIPSIRIQYKWQSTQLKMEF